MPNILADIVAHKRLELKALMASQPLDVLQAKVVPARGRFFQAIQKVGTNLIAEIKPKSPSAGIIKSDLDLEELVQIYSKYARAISVLTDKKYFDGSVELLARVSKLTELPLLCKDFVIEPYQVYLARSAGAEAVLVIVKILADHELRLLVNLIASLGMTPVVEVQNEQEIQRALSVNANCILINNRNLETLEIDLTTTSRLSPLLPAYVAQISASGVSERRQIEELKKFCSTFLIGSALMQSTNLEQQLAELRGPIPANNIIG
jgi:indole-3-glycerol phosphate synthase / phosphoribosylanthranilate isomerase